ncbi:hypothetical protein CDAR_81951 [Caerostris darwini]|uniref:Uncharacterized protein n=1 Tax=Caerostris darwini TaxID=1538125 RepID=A0AAV4V7J3_9ARAC|nr:hypothetical protein CDAR_81951 [Caerostris darwini]
MAIQMPSMPMIPNGHPDAMIPDTSMPIMPNGYPDAMIPDTSMPMIPNGHPDTSLPIIPNGHPDAMIRDTSMPMIPKARALGRPFPRVYIGPCTGQRGGKKERKVNASLRNPTDAAEERVIDMQKGIDGRV